MTPEPTTPPGAPHGTAQGPMHECLGLGERCGTPNGYVNLGCRAEKCLDGWRAYKRDRTVQVAPAPAHTKPIIHQAFRQMIVRPAMGDWVKDANCANVDPELFFPARGDSTADAKAVCRECVVMDECRTYALESNEHWGIWGGTSERERRRIRRQLARERRGVA